MVFPLLFLGLMWAVKATESVLQADLTFLGIYPLHIKGLPGIISAPLVHGNLRHLFNNSIPAFLLTWGLFYFYHKIALRVFSLIWLMSGLWIWFGAREAYHIGASGIIYGLGAFLFFSGIFRKNIHLTAISLLVIFLYGSMVWGIFPYKTGVSWESHLYGALAGLILASYYRKQGPPPTINTLPEEEDDDDISFDEYDAGDEVSESEFRPRKQKKSLKEIITGFFRDPFEPEEEEEEEESEQ